MYTLKNYFSKYLNMSSEAETTVPVETTAEKGDEPQEVAAGPSTSSMESKTENSEKKEKLLDLAFAMDCTGSMSSQIQQAKDNIRQIVEEIVSKESADVHLALVEYRDHPPQDSTFITRPHDFTSSVRTMKGWLEQCSANGGGDTPEAVADALHDLVKLSWRPGSTRVAVFITDAPPHGLGTPGDQIPQGCPLDLDPLEEARKLAQQSVTIYTVGCSPSTATQDFLMAIAGMTGGQYVPLRSANLLAKVIVGGAREEISLQNLMAEVNRQVEEEVNMQPAGTQASKQEITSNVFANLQARGYQSSHMQSVDMLGATSAVSAPSAESKKMSHMNNLAEVRTNLRYRTQSHRPSVGAYFDSACEDLLSGSPSYSPSAPSDSPMMLSSPPPPPGASAPSAYMAFMASSCPDMLPRAASSAPQDYMSVTDDVSYEQTYRMVTKAIATNRLDDKVAKE